jgi:hypothetical protein
MNLNKKGGLTESMAGKILLVLIFIIVVLAIVFLARQALGKVIESFF